MGLLGIRTDHSIWLCALFLALSHSPLKAQAKPSAADNPLQIMGQRQYLLHAHRRCNFFNDAEIMALTAGFLQSRNAAIRSNFNSVDIARTVIRANALSEMVPCDDKTLAGQVATLRTAYKSFVSQTNLELKGQRSLWKATHAYDDEAMWRLVQYQRQDQSVLALGLYGPRERMSLSVMAQFEGKQPYSARLVVRDTLRTNHGIIFRSNLPLSRTIPFGFEDGRVISHIATHKSVDMRVLGLDKRVNEAGFNLLGQHVATSERETVRFDFPTQALISIAKLDPREDIVIAFDFSDGPVFVRFEVGDFMTGFIFAKLPSPYTSNLPNRRQ